MNKVEVPEFNIDKKFNSEVKKIKFRLKPTNFKSTKGVLSGYKASKITLEE
jgi:hypothetical protein